MFKAECDNCKKQIAIGGDEAPTGWYQMDRVDVRAMGDRGTWLFCSIPCVHEFTTPALDVDAGVGLEEDAR